MNMEATHDPAFKIIKFLYQFKDDNKFYKLDEHSLNIPSKKEKYISIHTLRDRAMIATDTEVYHHADSNIVDHFNNADEIRAKILPKGVVAVESVLTRK